MERTSRGDVGQTSSSSEAVHTPDNHNVQVFMAHWHIGQAEPVHKVYTKTQVLAQLHVEGLCAGVLLGEGREQGTLQTHLHGTAICKGVPAKKSWAKRVGHHNGVKHDTTQRIAVAYLHNMYTVCTAVAHTAAYYGIS